MRVIEQHQLPNGADTKTMLDLGQVIGLKPEMSKAVVTLYPNLSLQKLTEQLGAVYHKDVDNLKEIEAFEFQWTIKTNQIPRIRFAEDCTETGEGGGEFLAILEEAYYAKNETFELENEQQIFVKGNPKQLAPKKWQYRLQLVADSISKKINTAYMTRGRTTKYVSNYQPELSEKGYNKLMYNIEKHRNFISRFRVGDSVSGDFTKLKTKYLEHAGQYFQMSTMEKDLVDLLYLSFENAMLLGHGNFDDKGNVLIREEDGRPIPMGEGLITQIKRFCGQQRYSTLSVTHFQDAINDVVEKLPKKTGNNIAFIVNWRLYQQAQIVMDNLLAPRVTDNYFYNMKGGKIAVGVEYCAYSFSGNTITFMENAALTNRYPDRGYGVFLDTSIYDGEPNIQMYTMKGMSFFKGTLRGMGGTTGGSSEENLGSMVHGHRVEYMGYRGCKVANPYSAHIIEENVIA